MILADDPGLALCVIGFDGPTLPGDVRDALARGLAGVALFARNLVEPGQVRELCREVRVAAGDRPPPIVAVDQEGGRVQRLRRLADPVPAMREVGAAGVDGAFQVGVAVARQCGDLGFNVDFAPVLDVDSNPANPIIGDRAFSADPREAAALAVSFAAGLRAGGVLPCGKHFPGHGDASLDSHVDLPVIEADRQTLERRELVPFAAAVDADFPMLMTAHCVFPAIDADVPATLSTPVIGGLLRGLLGYDGAVITDDLGMKAIADRFPVVEVLRRGLDASVDLFLHCGPAGEGLAMAAALSRGLSDGSLPRDPASAAATRVARLRGLLSR